MIIVWGTFSKNHTCTDLAVIFKIDHFVALPFPASRSGNMSSTIRSYSVLLHGLFLILHTLSNCNSLFKHAPRNE